MTCWMLYLARTNLSRSLVYHTRCIVVETGYVSSWLRREIIPRRQSSIYHGQLRGDPWLNTYISNSFRLIIEIIIVHLCVRCLIYMKDNNDMYFLIQRILWIATIVAVLSTYHAQASSEKSKRAIASNGGYIYEPPNEIFTLPPR